MRFMNVFATSNKSSEAANNFASCSCSANKTEYNAFFSDIAGVAVSVFLCIMGIICISDLIGIIILNLIALISILIGSKFMRKSQPAY